MTNPVSYESALALIREAASRFQFSRTENVRLDRLTGRVLSEDLFSIENLPSFDTSAMDGFAVKSAATAFASADAPVRFKVRGSLAAGDAFHENENVDAGVAWELMTGAGFPKGFDACVKQEDVEIHFGNKSSVEAITLRSPVSKDQNRRLSGEDFKPGALVLPKGHRVRDEDILCLAALGITQVNVIAKLRVGLIATGKELVSPDVKPQLVEVRNSTSPYLLAALKSRDVEAKLLGEVKDDPEAFLELVHQATAADSEPFDILITTGAISVGKYDFVAEALAKVGFKTSFQKVKIRPGKPLLFGQLPGGAFVVGLPGNPVATATGFRFFVDPLLRALQHLPSEKPLRLPLKEETRKASDATCFLKAAICTEADGGTFVIASGSQKASITHSLLKSNAWIVLNKDTPEIVPAGISVDVFPFQPAVSFT